MPNTFLAEPIARVPRHLSRGATPRGEASDHVAREPVGHEIIDEDALRLPAKWAAPTRPPIPVVASVVPLMGAIVLWLVTGSPMMLWFALLGPLIAVGSMIDGKRAARRARRQAEIDAAQQRERVAETVTRWQARERAKLWARHPDVALLMQRDAEIWRAAAGRDDALVLGAARVPSGLRVSGGEGDPLSARLRTEAAWITQSPLVVQASGGAVAVGPPVLASAVQRAWAIQLCAALPPGELRIVGPLRGDLEWAAELPHRRSTSGMALALIGPGEQPPTEAEIVLARSLPGEPLPPRCAAVLELETLSRAHLDLAGERFAIEPEGIALEQAQTIASMLNHRAAGAWGFSRDETPLFLHALPALPPAITSSGLAVAIGADAGEAAVVDLVSDGPHAVVAGVTGSGKSELLITWILALCSKRSTAEVNFLLADFKGGTAFDCLEGVPHVTGVITDLDGAGARRAIQSLRAEVRWREAAIASVGARDILDPRVTLPRLVVVVDEFAALLGDHPELHAVFTDVAARGRALGVHLILGTQRAAGVVRDSLLANCPLRISLRVTDGADSRALIGVEDAAMLPGGVEGRGIALIRRASDSRPRKARIALSQPSDIALARDVTAALPRRPWLPALPAQLSLAELLHGGASAAITLGLLDEPERQRQRPMTLDVTDRAILMIGGAGSGKTNALEVIAAQVEGQLIRIPNDPESAWDALAALVEQRIEPGTVILIDDLDLVPTRFGAEYAHAALECIEELVRTAGARGILVAASAHRLLGSVARIAELFPRRILLPLPSRADHLAAGGSPEHYAPDAPAGRGRVGGVMVQIATVPEPSTAPIPTLKQAWMPTANLTGYVARRSPAARDAISHWQSVGVRVASLDDYVAHPEVTADARVVVAGEPDEWQRHWRMLSQIRGDHDLVIDASCAAEFRVLTGWRALPPYVEPGRARAWLTASGGDPQRITLPTIDQRPAHP
ncbi:FtsK/SpoIIIE domain-containing protein [Microbacterium sp. NPDC076911]|uniref:FtsK/SpoIIIE domain-containing protein n=1 Tax=Microbacterium sp. NPDC076911 TaxID=3154958 RepID=UPI003414A5D6